MYLNGFVNLKNEDKPKTVLKLICLTIVQWIKQVWWRPQTVAHAIKERRQQVVRNVLEAERLDRIRNPSSIWGSDGKLDPENEPKNILK